MAIATRVTSTLSPTITQQSLSNAIKQAFIDIGIGTVYSEYIPSSDNSLRTAFQIVIDPSKSAGVIYFRVRVMTNLVVGIALSSSWDLATNTSTNPSNEFVSSAFATTGAITINAINGGSEFKLVHLVQGSIVAPLCFINPLKRPTWWDLNQWNYGFINTINTFNTFSSTGLNPYANSLYDVSLNNSRLSNPNAQTNKRDIQLGFTLYTQSSRGIAGLTSDDLVSIAAASTIRFDTVRTVENREYLILHSAAGGLGCRVT